MPIPPPPHNPQLNSELSNTLQTISLTLSDIQVQLHSIQEQNLGRDATLNKLEKDICELKGKRPADEFDSPQLKKSRKSPCGLSVNAFSL